MGDITDSLTAHVQQAFADKQALRIVGGNSKSLLGRRLSGEPLELTRHSGIVDYQPTELVISARAGTPLVDIESALAEHGQMLPFEPPQLGESATLGGTIACGLSGPRRPFAGAARDFVLGVKMLNGRGECLQFGGQVMKNVAGYDVSRLQVGAQGMLGVLLEVSLKVLPSPSCERSLRMEMDAPTAIATMARFSASPLPLSAACHLPADSIQAGQLWLRLSGAEQAVTAASAALQKELSAFAPAEVEDPLQAAGFWRDLGERRLAFFDQADVLWRLAVPPATADFMDSNEATPVNTPSLANEVLLPGKCLLDWAGAQRWLHTEASIETVQAAAQQLGGHATLFSPEGARQTALPPGLAAIHRRLKAAFDPAGILNPGRLYADL